MGDKLDLILDGQRELERKVDVLCERMPRDAKVRLDRLEQAEKARIWWTRTALGGAVLALIGAAWSVLTTGKVNP